MSLLMDKITLTFRDYSKHAHRDGSDIQKNEGYLKSMSVKLTIMFSSENLTDEIAFNFNQHSHSTEWYEEYSARLSAEVKLDHRPGSQSLISLGKIGEINFPFFSMGNVDSSNLFGLDELILFSYYAVNQNNYRKVLDLGANIGLHSIVLIKLGFEVTSYEPDPFHIEQILQNFRGNNFSSDGIVEAAVSTANEKKEFVRILGNTTGSHLAGAKSQKPYGGHETFLVRVRYFNDIMISGFDLIKMDVEGHEAALISHLDSRYFQTTDIILEVGTQENAELIYNKTMELGLNLFSQKINWELVKSLADVPFSYKEGSLFITPKKEMNWSQAVNQ